MREGGNGSRARYIVFLGGGLGIVRRFSSNRPFIVSLSKMRRLQRTKGPKHLRWGVGMKGRVQTFLGRTRHPLQSRHHPPWSSCRRRRCQQGISCKRNRTTLYHIGIQRGGELEPTQPPMRKKTRFETFYIFTFININIPFFTNINIPLGASATKENELETCGKKL